MTVRIIVGCFFLACSPAFAQKPADIRVDVDLVTVAAFVEESTGAPVKGLRREDFTLRDNGQPREINSLWQEDVPLTIGFVADVSGSQIGALRKHKETITTFLSQTLRPEDQAFIVTVDAEVRVVAELTNSIEKLRTGIDAIRLPRRGSSPAGERLGEPCRSSQGVRERRGRILCASAIWDGVYYTSKLKMKSLPGRKALILLSDGFDAGSYHSVNDAIEAAQSADTMVYGIRHLSILQKTSYMTPIMLATHRGMQRLAEETGGQMLKDSKESFAEIETELRNLYVLGFVPPEQTRDGKFHKLEVKVNRPGATVRARKGYTASLPTVNPR